MVKEFTSYGVRQEEGHWFAHQVEVKTRGQAGSTLLIFDRGSAKAKLTLPISALPRSHSSRRPMHVALWIVAVTAVLLAAGCSIS